MHASMLADIEGVKMKSKLADLSQERANVDVSEAPSAIRKKAVAQQQYVILKLCSTCIRRWSIDGFAAALQPMKDVREKATIALRLIVRSPSEMHARNGALIVCQSGEQLIGNARLPA